MAIERRKSAEKATKPAAKPAATGQVQSLARGLNILKALADSDHALTLSEVCDEVQLASSTAHRLLSSLEQQSFVEQDKQRGRWSIGVQAFNVGNGYLKTRDVVSIARPFMRELMETTGETCNLGILDGTSAVLIAQIECKEIMRMVAQLGGRTPMHVSGVGKAILATLPKRRIHDLVTAHQFSVATDNTMRDQAQFISHLDSISAQGYSVDDEEQSVGLRCIAAPIFNEHHEPIAAISISGPRLRITDQRIESLGLLIKSIAQQITVAMGGK